MKTQKLIRLLTLTTVVIALWCPAQTVPKLINYQGKLMDAGNNPLPNGTYGVSFRIWSKNATTEPGDQLIWGQDYNVAVANGVFNVILGAPGGTPIPGAAINDLGFAFGESSRFAGITVTRGTDGNAIPGTTEIIPRQQILSTPYAMRADFATVAQNVITVQVPQGVITMWSGSLASIPNGWALCDGSQGTPDLRDRFIVGAGSSYLVSGTGGSTSHNHGGNTGSHNLTIEEMPQHSHATPYIQVGSAQPLGTGLQEQAAVAGQSHLVTGVSTFPTGSGTAHSHQITVDSNLPPYYALAFIMKL